MTDITTQTDRMLRAPAVLELIGVSRTTLWRMIRRAEFPALLQLSPNTVGWPESLVTEWRAGLATVPYAPGPEAIEQPAAA